MSKNAIIRQMYPKEYPLLEDFLYEAIFLPEGVAPPSREIISLPELQLYIADFGTQQADFAVVAEVDNKIVGVAWSINTLDEAFRRDMDKAVSIERRLEAMRQFHDAGIRTTCFISPIFPEITDVKAVIERVKGQCNLIWLENLNLRGDYKAVIMNYIREKYPHLLGTYQEIYQKGNPVYWESLNLDLKHYTESIGLESVRNDDSMQRPFEAPPIVVNFFYHSQITKSATKAKAVP